jgi:hypothetical protein
MLNPASFWLYAGLGLLISTLGAGWVIQSKLITYQGEKRARFAWRLLGSGYMVITVGIVYIAVSMLVV